MTPLANAIKEAQATALFSLDDAIAGLCQVMGEYLGVAAKLRAQGKSPARALRMAARCIAPLLRLARHAPQRLPEILRLAQVTITAAEDETRRARVANEDETPYLDVRFIAQTQLARLGDILATAENKAARAERKRQPPNDPIPEMAALVAPSQSPRAKHSPRPLTQRAQWLAEREGKRPKRR